MRFNTMKGSCGNELSSAPCRGSDFCWTLSHSLRCGLLSHATPWLNYTRDPENLHAHRRRGERRPARGGTGCPPCAPNMPDAPLSSAPGGPKMAAAGVELEFDLTQHSAIGISDVLKNLFEVSAGCSTGCSNWPSGKNRMPSSAWITAGSICASATPSNNKCAKHPSASTPWYPKIIQFVSPQVWASRPGRANRLAADYDLLLSIFPFEKDWYAQRVPELRVEFVGHPMVGRFAQGLTSPRGSNDKSGSSGTRPLKFCFCPAAGPANCNGTCR